MRERDISSAGRTAEAEACSWLTRVGEQYGIRVEPVIEWDRGPDRPEVSLVTLRGEAWMIDVKGVTFDGSIHGNYTIAQSQLTSYIKRPGRFAYLFWPLAHFASVEHVASRGRSFPRGVGGGSGQAYRELSVADIIIDNPFTKPIYFLGIKR